MTDQPSDRGGDDRAGLLERLADLEQRVERVERATGPEAREPSAHEQVFWALEGLRPRVGEGGGVCVTGIAPLPGGGRAEWQEGHDAAELVDDDWEPTAPVLAALGNPVRLRLLRAVLHGTRTAAELACDPGVGTTGQVYHHLRQLTAAGWLRPSTGAARGSHEVPVARVVPLLAVLALCRR